MREDFSTLASLGGVLSDRRERHVRVSSDDEVALDAGVAPGARKDGRPGACETAGGGREDRTPLRDDAAGDGRARGGGEGQVWGLLFEARFQATADDVHGRGGAGAGVGAAL